ncbi:hypothetical protein [Streptomyces sp. NPDC002564]
MNEHAGAQRPTRDFISSIFNRPILGLLVALVLIVAIWIGLQLVLPAVT